MAKVDPIALALTLATEKRLRSEIEQAKMSGPQGKRGAKGASVKGDRGDDGAAGKTGEKGNTVKGLKGDVGARGKGGERGPQGISRAGQAGVAGKIGPVGPAGPQGGKGLQGQIGRTPAHQWKGTKLQFEKPDGDWGVEVDLIGKSGVNTFTRMGTGGGGGQFESIVIVKLSGQLAGVLDSDKLYLIDGHIDMNDQEIIVPIGGLNIAGTDLNTASLYSSLDGHTLFNCDQAVGCGDLYLTKIGLKADGVGARIFHLDNKEAGGRIGWRSVNFNDCTSLGTITNYNQALAQNIGWVDCVDGLTVDGTWGGGWAVLNSIILGGPFTGTLFKAGSTLSIGGSFRSNINLLQLDESAGTFCDFAPANIVLDAGFTLSNVRVKPSADPLPNMPATSVKALIKDCAGLANTYQGGVVTPNADSEIVITTQDVLVQITGAVTLSDAYWVSVGNTNGIQSDSSLEVQAHCDGILSFAGTSGAEIGIQLRQYVAASSSYVNVGPEYLVSIFGGVVYSLASNVVFAANVTLQQDDRVEVWVKNKSSTDNITLKSGGQFEVLGR